jgi:hypothetical protein
MWRLLIDAAESQHTPPTLNLNIGAQINPQPRVDFPSMLAYLKNDVVSVPLQPHLASCMCRCSAIALRFGRGVCVLPAATFKFYCHKRDFAAGISVPMFFRVGLRQSPPSLSPPFLNFFGSCRYSISLLKCECTTDYKDALSRARGQRSSRCQRAPLRAEYSTCLASRKQKSFINAPSRHVNFVNAKGFRKRP